MLISWIIIMHDPFLLLPSPFPPASSSSHHLSPWASIPRGRSSRSRSGLDPRAPLGRGDSRDVLRCCLSCLQMGRFVRRGTNAAAWTDPGDRTGKNERSRLPSFRAIACSEISGATFGASPSEFSGATFRPPAKPLARSPQEPLKISLNLSVCPHRLRSCRLESLTCPALQLQQRRRTAATRATAARARATGARATASRAPWSRATGTRARKGYSQWEQPPLDLDLHTREAVESAVPLGCDIAHVAAAARYVNQECDEARMHRCRFHSAHASLMGPAC